MDLLKLFYIFLALCPTRQVSCAFGNVYGIGPPLLLSIKTKCFQIAFQILKIDLLDSASFGLDFSIKNHLAYF